MAKTTGEHRPEYRLLIAPHMNERTLKPTTLAILETVQSFAAFRYELSVEERIEKQALTLKVLGLRTPGLNLPSAGRARFLREYEGLKGTTTITVIGLDGKSTSCSVRISQKRVELLKPPPGTSLHVVTDRNLWNNERSLQPR